MIQQFDHHTIMKTNKNILTEGATLLLILLWAYTGLAKALDFQEFRRAMLNQPFPNQWGEFLAMGIPALELLLAGLLLWQATRLGGLIASLVLMTSFTVYVGLIWIKAFERVPCGCAGIFESMGWGTHVLVNALLVLLTAVGIHGFKGGKL